jgi:hypothetical protein
MYYLVSALFACVGIASIVNAAAFGAGWVRLALGCLWLVCAACFIPAARQFSRRARLGFDRTVPAAEQDVLTLLKQGRNIEAIKRYRELNPGVGLREARHAVDGLNEPDTSRT